MVVSKNPNPEQITGNEIDAMLEVLSGCGVKNTRIGCLHAGNMKINRR